MSSDIEAYAPNLREFLEGFEAMYVQYVEQDMDDQTLDKIYGDCSQVRVS